MPLRQLLRYCHFFSCQNRSRFHYVCQVWYTGAMINYSLRRVVTAIFLLLIPILIMANPSAINHVVNYVKTDIIRTCDTIDIPFEKIIKDDPNITPSNSYTQTRGQNGKSTICENGHGSVASEEILQAKTDEIRINGTYVSPPPKPIQLPEYYTAPTEGGAICNDGTRSYSTGRGTCSWHGGIDYYL